MPFRSDCAIYKQNSRQGDYIKRSKLKNKYLKSKSEGERQRYAKQRNLDMSFLGKTKKELLFEIKVIANQKF